MTSSADLTALGYRVDVAPDGSVAAIDGFGLAVTIRRQDAAARFAEIVADHPDRLFWHLHPDAYRARLQLQNAGYTVTRVDASADVFTLQAPPGKPPARPSPATPDQLVTIVQTLAAPPQPTLASRPR